MQPQTRQALRLVGLALFAVVLVGTFALIGIDVLDTVADMTATEDD
jgi:hypothetical protein